MAPDPPTLNPRRFRIALVGIVGAWFLLSWLYALHFPLIADEFQGAHSAAQLLERLPYRDFAPYKTVLGYFVQLPVLAAIGDPWAAVLGVRVEMVAVGAFMLVLAGLRLHGHFRGEAVLVGMFLLLASSTFLERAGELRVDMLTAWAGLGSLLFLMAARWGWGGALAAVAFFVSQKGAYFAIAGAAGILAIAPLIGARRAGRAVLHYVGAGIGVASAYLLFWSMVASPAEVARIVFVGPAQLAAGDLYRDVPGAVRWAFWRESVQGNVAFYGLAIAGLSIAAATGLSAYRRSRAAEPEPGERGRGAVSSDRVSVQAVLFGYALSLVVLYALHRQPWPYFIATLAPTLGVVVISAADRLISSTARHRLARVVIPSLILFGSIPLTEIPTNLAWRNNHQAATVRRIDALLEPGDGYLAGVHLLPRGDQAPEGLTWLDRRATARLAELTPVQVTELARVLRETPIKLFVHTAQVSLLPTELQETLLAEFLLYEPYLYVYAPTVLIGESSVSIRYSGRYLVEATGGAELLLDGDNVVPGDVLSLGVGPHASAASESYRLRFLPSSPPAGPQERPPLPFFSRSVMGGLTTWADSPPG